MREVRVPREVTLTGMMRPYEPPAVKDGRVERCHSNTWNRERKVDSDTKADLGADCQTRGALSHHAWYPQCSDAKDHGPTQLDKDH